jgi:hypothetical protein
VVEVEVLEVDEGGEVSREDIVVVVVLLRSGGMK